MVRSKKLLTEVWMQAWVWLIEETVGNSAVSKQLLHLRHIKCRKLGCEDKESWKALAHLYVCIFVY